jgi:SAM-dependent methyltransferase
LIQDSDLTPASSNENIKANRPEPITSEIEVVAFDSMTEPQDAVDALVEGYSVLVVDYYSSGLTLLNALKHFIKKEYSDDSFQGQRDFRSKFQKFSNQILLEVSDNKLAVKKAPEIGWLKKLYPELSDFLLPFTQVQGLNSSWQWYKKGISIPVLKRKIHPWFGTYFPTRFEHLELFNSWIRRYKGEKKSVFDIGIGSGVLSFLLLKQGFEKVYGTDFNPNAIIGLQEGANVVNSKIELLYGDLFAESNEKSELIVFNPPWLPASQDLNEIDKAIYYTPDLFSRFFTEAEKHLQANGRIVLLFSNLAQITKVDDSHPIEKELTDGNRFEKELFIQKQVRSASKKTNRNQSWRSEEKVELWVLKLKTKK